MPIFRDRQSQRGLQVNYSESDMEVSLNDAAAVSVDAPAGIVDQLLGFGGRTRGRTGGAQSVRPGGVTGRGRGRAAQAPVFTAPVIGEFKNAIIP